MKIKSFLLTALMSLAAFTASADDFFSTEPAEKLFTFGARLGVNASNRTFSSSSFDAWNVNSWGTGFQVGAVANINFRDYLSVQPGIFFESRSGNYSYAADYLSNAGNPETFYQLGHLRSYNFTIPVMGVVKFNVLDELKWLVEFGPYFQIKLHSSDGNQILVPVRAPNAILYDQVYAESNSVDFGFKMGTGLKLFDHYYFGIHYSAGILNVWKFPEGGRNKAWLFTLGYDF